MSQIQKLKWRTADGRSLAMQDMEASHLFFCVRMIWNHSVPETFKLHPYKRWRFRNPKRYATALPHLVENLAQKKEELEPWMLGELRWMAINSGVLKLSPANQIAIDSEQSHEN